MTHDPWVTVCPATRRPIHVESGPASPRVLPAIPRSPQIPGGGSRPAMAAVVPRDMRAPMAVPRPPTAPQAPMTPPATPPQPPVAPSTGAIPRQGPSETVGRAGPNTPPTGIGRTPPARERRSSPGVLRNLIGRVIGDRYGVTSLIGEGGMGEVYEAEHLAIGRLVAVKVLNPRRAQDREAISRLRHEARVAGTLGHPNICAIYDMGRLDDGSPYLVMERLHGETLAQRLQRESVLPQEDLVDLMTQVLSALVAAHQRGVIHRDLKPDNIFLSRREGMRPIPKLLDFGISKAEDMEETAVDPTGATIAAGTPFYMAPEQARGDRKLDHRIDLWSAGVILYECLTGTRPFDAKNYNALLVQILSVPHRPVRELRPEIDPALGHIVDQALAKTPEGRFQTALELQNALRSLPVKASSVSTPALQAVGRRIANEPTSDDSDATFVFTRGAIGLKPAEPAPEPAPSEVEESTPIYMPFADDDERTVVEEPLFLDDGVTTVRRDTIPMPSPPRRKE